MYWAQPKNGKLALATGEHHDIRWCSADELDKLQPPMSDAVKWYCRTAIRGISSQP
jgi:8-oxo-dGTP pyrophosphatase MutT (NUDIX family)